MLTIIILLLQTANKLLELYSKLRELGHPDYQHHVQECLHCTITWHLADDKVGGPAASQTCSISKDKEEGEGDSVFFVI